MSVDSIFSWFFDGIINFSVEDIDLNLSYNMYGLPKMSQRGTLFLDMSSIFLYFAKRKHFKNDEK